MVSRKLPLELEEEILTRLPPQTLVCFRAVCKDWNALFNDKIFVNNHLACASSRPEFVLQTASKIYSLSINLNNDEPNIMKVRELIFDIPGLTSLHYEGFFFFYDEGKGFAVWNPCLRQIRWIESELRPYKLCGMGYDISRPENSHKIFGFFVSPERTLRFAIYEVATNTWKCIDHEFFYLKLMNHEFYIDQSITEESLWYNNVFLNGNLYWIAYNVESCQHFIRVFDCSKEILKPFCILPYKKKDPFYCHVLAVFKGDRFSLLDQEFGITTKIEIWVTKKKVTNVYDGDAVVWIKFMSVSIPNFPRLDRTSSYILDEDIYGKSFVLCHGGETGQACVYIVRGNIYRKMNIDVVVGKFESCSVYVPNLIPIP